MRIAERRERRENRSCKLKFYFFIYNYLIKEKKIYD